MYTRETTKYTRKTTKYKIHKRDNKIHKIDYKIHTKDYKIHTKDYKIHKRDYKIHNRDYETHTIKRDHKIHSEISKWQIGKDAVRVIISATVLTHKILAFSLKEVYVLFDNEYRPSTACSARACVGTRKTYLVLSTDV